MGFHVLDWMLALPFQLAWAGLVDEAATLAARFSEVTTADNFLPDRALILAKAGRRDDALAQLTENLLRFPDDPWVIIKSGDVYETLGDNEQAERLYRQGLDLAGEDQYTRLGALERLFPLLDDAGRSEEANVLFEEESKRRTSAAKVRDSLGTNPSSVGSITSLDDTDEELFLSEDDDDDLLFTPYTRTLPKIGRNDICPCGSGKKYKKCCLK